MEKVIGTEKRNSFLNFLKVFACINVVLIHVRFPGKFGTLVAVTGSYAVPLFFLIAGYYSFAKDKDTIKRRLLKTFYIFIFAYICFFIFRISYAAYDHQALQWLANNYKITQLAKYIIFCTIQFAYPLWYLIAQIETYIFWFIVVKHRKEGLIVKLIPFMFIAHVLLTTYSETTGLYLSYKTNFITSSLSWFTLGYYIHSLPKEKIQKISTKALIVLAVLGWIITCLPTAFDLKLKFSCIGHIPFAVSLFLIALKMSDINIHKSLDYFGDKMSLWIYIFHIPISSILTSISIIIYGKNISKNDIYMWIHPLLTILVTSIVSFLFSIFLRRISQVKYK